MRFDDPTIYNPYGWRLAELARSDAGDGDGEQRRRLVEDMVVWEAIEAAHGYRHVTIVHGDPDDLASSRRLSALYEALRDGTRPLAWVRVRGTADYVTVTVGGPDADQSIAEVLAVAGEADPGGWQITSSAFPVSVTP